MCPHLLHPTTLITQLTVIYEEKHELQTANLPNFSQNLISWRLPCGFGLSGWVFSHPAAFPKRSFPPPTVDPSPWATGWNAPWLGSDRNIYNEFTFGKSELNIWSYTLGNQTQQYETSNKSKKVGFSRIDMLCVNWPSLVLCDRGWLFGLVASSRLASGLSPQAAEILCVCAQFLGGFQPQLNRSSVLPSLKLT